MLFSKKQENSTISFIGYKCKLSFTLLFESSLFGSIILFIIVAPPFKIVTVLFLIYLINAKITSFGDIFSIKFSINIVPS